MAFKRVVVTGLGALTPLGKTVADYLKESGDVKVTEFKRVALG